MTQEEDDRKLIIKASQRRLDYYKSLSKEERETRREEILRFMPLDDFLKLQAEAALER